MARHYDAGGRSILGVSLAVLDVSTMLDTGDVEGSQMMPTLNSLVI